MKKKILTSVRWLALLFLLCGSCKKSAVENQQDVITIKAQAQSPHLSLIDAFPLELPKEGPALGHVHSITVLENYIIILDSLRNSIEVFDKEGNYKWSIGSRGDGEGQYKIPIALAAIPNTGQMLIYDGGTGTGQPLRFSIQGEFLGQLKLSERRFISRMVVSKDHNLIHTYVDKNENSMLCVTSLDTGEDLAKFKVCEAKYINLFFSLLLLQGLAYDEAQKIIYFTLPWEDKVMRIDFATQDFLIPIVTNHPKFVSFKLDEVDDSEGVRELSQHRFSTLDGMHLLSSGDIVIRYMFEDSSISTALILLSDLSVQPSAQEVKNELGYNVFTCYDMSVYEYVPAVDDEDTNGRVRVYRLTELQGFPTG